MKKIQFKKEDSERKIDHMITLLMMKKKNMIILTIIKKNSQTMRKKERKLCVITLGMMRKNKVEILIKK